jgi:Na+-driven multidrug efflux pump
MGVTGAAFATALASLLSQLAGILTLKRDIALRFLINSLLPIKLINMNKSYAKSN